MVGLLRADFVRHLLGREHMRLLSLPREIATHNISDRQLRVLAGNSLSVTWSAVISVFLLASVGWEKAKTLPPLANNNTSRQISTNSIWRLTTGWNLPICQQLILSSTNFKNKNQLPYNSIIITHAIIISNEDREALIIFVAA